MFQRQIVENPPPDPGILGVFLALALFISSQKLDTPTSCKATFPNRS